MNYGILLSVDVPSSEDIEDFLPPASILGTLEVTEGDEEYGYDYLEGEWEQGYHRKLVGVLNQAQFDELVLLLDLYAEDVETTGSIGVPWGSTRNLSAPAVSFQSRSRCAIIDAYVTPIPSFEPVNRSEDEAWQDRCWERVRRAVINKYKR